MKKKRKRTRTECFQMIGKIEHIQRICSNPQYTVNWFISSGDLFAETLRECQQLLEDLAPEFTKRELHG